MVVVLPVDRVVADVAQRVVHPAHVPLEAEAEPAEVRRPRDAGPGGGLLGDRERARRAAVDGGVHLLEELRPRRGSPGRRTGSGIHSPSLAGVVEVEHRGHRVDAQAVDVELLEPVAGVGDEEVADLGAAEVEDQRAPVGVLAAARVAVLVERRAVEAGQRPRVLGEVGGHPVDDHADAGLVQPVDEVAEVVRGAEARGRRVVGGDLVAPGAAEGVLGHRQELDVGEAELLRRRRRAGRRARGSTGPAPPRAEVHLVDAHRVRGRRAAARGASSSRSSPQV